MPIRHRSGPSWPLHCLDRHWRPADDDDGDGNLQLAGFTSARYKNAFSQIEVQLKRRYDLIPNLVETAKGYMKHESETLENVIKARNAASSAMQAASAAPGSAEAMKGLNGAAREGTRIVQRRAMRRVQRI